jgi:hypothetical protein
MGKVQILDLGIGILSRKSLFKLSSHARLRALLLLVSRRSTRTSRSSEQTRPKSITPEEPFTVTMEEYGNGQLPHSPDIRDTFLQSCIQATAPTFSMISILSWYVLPASHPLLYLCSPFHHSSRPVNHYSSGRED